MSEPWSTNANMALPTRKGFAEVSSRGPWPHEQEGVQIPMPGGKRLMDLETGAYQRVEGDGLGCRSEANVISQIISCLGVCSQSDSRI